MNPTILTLHSSPIRLVDDEAGKDLSDKRMMRSTGVSYTGKAYLSDPLVGHR